MRRELSVLRVDASELVETDPHGEGLWGMTFQGAPFTGVAFELHANGQLASEVSFLMGNGHGPSRYWNAEGTLVRAYEMDRGSFVGEGRGWWPDGTPRWLRHYGTRNAYREQQWNRAGVCVLERNDAAGETRSWYDDGTLAHERVGNLARHYASDGTLLVTMHRRADGLDDLHFEDEAMAQRIDEELIHPERWHLAGAFLHNLAQRERPRSITLLRHVLGGENKLAKIDVMPLVAQLQLTELVPELESLASEETVPKLAATSGGGRRGSTFSVGRVARDALAWLRR